MPALAFPLDRRPQHLLDWERRLATAQLYVAYPLGLLACLALFAYHTRASDPSPAVAATAGPYLLVALMGFLGGMALAGGFLWVRRRGSGRIVFSNRGIALQFAGDNPLMLEFDLEHIRDLTFDLTRPIRTNDAPVGNSLTRYRISNIGSVNYVAFTYQLGGQPQAMEFRFNLPTGREYSRLRYQLKDWRDAGVALRLV